MTKIDWSKYPPIPGFDSMKWKYETQRKIYEEIKDMTWEEQRERTRKRAEHFDADIERIRAERAAEATGELTEPVA
jgi:hypothetical protein